jgi:RHS repeat-associated protein
MLESRGPRTIVVCCVLTAILAVRGNAAAVLGPVSGIAAYHAPGSYELPKGLEIDTVARSVVLTRTDLTVDTHLGAWPISASYDGTTHTTSRRWRFNFETTYDGATFVDPTGATHAIGALPNGSQIPGTHWIKLDADRIKTLGGLVYEFCSGAHLLRVYWDGHPEVRLQMVLRTLAGGGQRIETITQCLSSGCHPIYAIEYGAGGRVIGITDHSGRRSMYRYNMDGTLAFAKDALDVARGWPGHRYTYTGTTLRIRSSENEDVVVTFDSADSRVTRIEYVGEGNPAYQITYTDTPSTDRYKTNVRDPLGNTTTYTYDGSRRLVSRRLPMGDLDSFTWDIAGGFPYEIKTHTDPAGVETRWERTANTVFIIHPGRTLGVTHPPLATPAANTTSPTSRPVLEMADGAGPMARQAWDAGGRLQWSENGAGERTTYTYGANGEITGVTGPDGTPRQYSGHGLHGHAATVTTYGSHARYVYDAVGNLAIGALATAESGGVRRWHHDEARQRATVELDGLERDGSSTFSTRSLTVEYRSDGLPRRIRRPGGGDTQYDYDALGRLSARTEYVSSGAIAAPVARTTRYEYDIAGRLTALIRPNVMRAEATHDAQSRIASIRFKRGAVTERTVNLSYTSNRLTRRTGTGGFNESYTFDTAGRIATVTYSGGERLEIAYDARSRPIRRTYRLGSTTVATLHVGYDNADRITSLRLDSSPLVTSTFGHARLEHEAFGNGLSRTYEYDGAGTLATSTTTRSGGQRVERTEPLVTLSPYDLPFPELRAEIAGAGGTTVSIEKRDSLLGAFGGRIHVFNNDESAPPGSLHDSYWFDHLSNLVLVNHALGTLSTQYAYNAEGNRLLRMERPGQPAVDYTYDEAGFVTSRAGVGYAWTAAGDIGAIGNLHFLYDALGRLAARWYDAGPTRSWRFGGQIEFDSAGRPMVLDLGVVRVDLLNGNHLFRHLDHRGNVRFVTDIAGNVVANYYHGPFGLDRAFGSPFDTDVRFAQGFDAGDVMVLGARPYDPRAARFLAPDPVDQVFNQYAYALGNPIAAWDPDGTSGADKDPHAHQAEKAAHVVSHYAAPGHLTEWWVQKIVSCEKYGVPGLVPMVIGSALIIPVVMVDKTLHMADLLVVHPLRLAGADRLAQTFLQSLSNEALTFSRNAFRGFGIIHPDLPLDIQTQERWFDNFSNRGGQGLPDDPTFDMEFRGVWHVPFEGGPGES